VAGDVFTSRYTAKKKCRREPLKRRRQKKDIKKIPQQTPFSYWILRGKKRGQRGRLEVTGQKGLKEEYEATLPGEQRMLPKQTRLEGNN